MTKVSTLHYALVHFWVPFFFVVSFCYANSSAATRISGNEELSKTSLEVHDDEEAKFKGFFHIKPIVKKPFFKKPIIPIVKPIIPNPYPLVKKPIPVLFNKPISKSFGVKKPIPIPVYKPIPIVKPIPKLIPIVKPINVPVYKPIPKPLIVKKPNPIPVFKKPFSVPKKPFFPPHIPSVEP